MKFIRIYEPEKYMNIFTISKDSNGDYVAYYKDKNRALFYKNKNSYDEWTEIPFCFSHSKDEIIRFFETVEQSAFNTPLLNMKHYGDIADKFEVDGYEFINNPNYEYKIGYTNTSNL